MSALPLVLIAEWSAVAVALPAIRLELGASATGVLMLLLALLVPPAVLLVPAGRLVQYRRVGCFPCIAAADRVGRRHFLECLHRRSQGRERECRRGRSALLQPGRLKDTAELAFDPRQYERHALRRQFLAQLVEPLHRRGVNEVDGTEIDDHPGDGC